MIIAKGHFLLRPAYLPDAESFERLSVRILRFGRSRGVASSDFFNRVLLKTKSCRW